MIMNFILQTASLEELLLIKVESLEEMRFVNEIVTDWLIEWKEHKRHVLSNFFLNLSCPLGEIFAILDQAVVGVKAELNLIENIFSVVVAWATIDCQWDRRIAAGNSAIQASQNTIEIVTILHERVDLFVALKGGLCIFQISDFLAWKVTRDETPVFIAKIEIESGSGK